MEGGREGGEEKELTTAHVSLYNIGRNLHSGSLFTIKSTSGKAVFSDKLKRKHIQRNQDMSAQVQTPYDECDLCISKPY